MAQLNAATNAARIPEAAFESDVVDGAGPLTVEFIDDSKYFPVAWVWEFGDGNTSEVQIATVADYITVGGVEEESPPSPPQDLGVEDSGDYFIQLGWEPPADEGSSPLQGYQVEYKNNGLAILADDDYVVYDTTTDTNMTLTGLGSRKDYNFRVAAYNLVGLSDYAGPLDQDTPPVNFPLSAPCLLMEANNNYTDTIYVYTTQNEEGYDPAADGDTVLVWGYNGGLIIQNTEAYRPVYRAGLTNGDRVFNAIEFQGGTRMNWPDASQFLSQISGSLLQTGFEAVIVMRRMEAQPSTDRQTNGLWWLTSENPPAETDDTDTHYPEDNQVIYERFASGTNTADPRRNIFPVPIDVTEWHIYQVRGREGEYKIWINGVEHYNSATNLMDFAPTAPKPTIGVSYFYPPVDDDDTSSMYAGYFQMAELVIFRPEEADPDQDIDEPTAADTRAFQTLEMFRYYKDKYDIELQEV